MNRPAEVPAIPCVGVTETAAEKLVSLTRRTAMDLAGLSRDFDPALVRHVYDLHVLRGHVNRGRLSPRSHATSPRPMPTSTATSILPITPTSPARPRRRSMRSAPIRRTASATIALSPRHESTWRAGGLRP